MAKTSTLDINSITCRLSSYRTYVSFLFFIRIFYKFLLRIYYTLGLGMCTQYSVFLYIYSQDDNNACPCPCPPHIYSATKIHFVVRYYGIQPIPTYVMEGSDLRNCFCVGYYVVSYRDYATNYFINENVKSKSMKLCDKPLEIVTTLRLLPIYIFPVREYFQ